MFLQVGDRLAQRKAICARVQQFAAARVKLWSQVDFYDAQRSKLAGIAGTQAQRHAAAQQAKEHLERGRILLAPFVHRRRHRECLSISQTSTSTLMGCGTAPGRFCSQTIEESKNIGQWKIGDAEAKGNRT